MGGKILQFGQLMPLLFQQDAGQAAASQVFDPAFQKAAGLQIFGGAVIVFYRKGEKGFDFGSRTDMSKKRNVCEANISADCEWP